MKWILHVDDKTTPRQLIAQVCNVANLPCTAKYFVAQGNIELPMDSSLVNQGIKEKTVLELRQETISNDFKNRNSVKSCSARHKSIRLDEPLNIEQSESKQLEQRRGTENTDRPQSLFAELWKALKRLCSKL